MLLTPGLLSRGVVQRASMFGIWQCLEQNLEVRRSQLENAGPVYSQVPGVKQNHDSYGDENWSKVKV